jgi:hypothetical protein
MKKKVDKKRQAFEKWANAQLKEIQDILGLNDFMLAPIRRSPDDGKSTAEVRFPYKDIYIAYSEYIKQAWEDGNPRVAYHTLMHEMIHMLTGGLFAVARDRWASDSQITNENEQLTDRLANVITKLTYDTRKQRTSQD